MGEAPYPWPVAVWFCDYCDKPCGAGEHPRLCYRCGRDSLSSVVAAPVFHWQDEKDGVIGG